AVIISSFAALTFTPMLATKILKRRDKKSWFYNKTEPFFVGLTNIYEKGLNAFLRHKWMGMALVIVSFVGVIYFWGKTPTELAPLEDRSSITVRILGQEGSTFEYIRDYTDEITNIVDSMTPEKQSIVSRASSGNGFVNLFLTDIQDRNRSQMEIAEALSNEVRKATAARSFVQQQSTFGGRRGGMPVNYVLQAPSLEKLQEFIPTFMEEVNASPVFRMADVDLKFTKPETRIIIDRDKATLLGVSTRNIAQTLQYALSGQRMGYFYMNGKQYQILGEINRQQRNKPLDLKAIYVRNDNGHMISLDNLVTFEENVAPPKLYRYNRFISATVSSGLAPGYTIGDGIKEMDRIADKVLDDSFRTALSGESKEFSESSSSLLFAFALAIVLIILVLAAQFESFKDPFIVMTTVPLALVGGLIFMQIFGITMNIYSEIGLIMLIGLVAKNGILIVEFANQRQKEGLSKKEAVRSAAVQRMRPILMTSVSTILGLIPLMFATGEGAQGRIAMGTGVVGGMLISTILCLFVVPAIYEMFSTNQRQEEIIND
ncbi:MAG: efflux RND transporter permease subunit, partial [Bacteroidales bacterium]|nr:efflux RND transporter permease subunit [Bacteroidales bacterium]